MNEYICDLLSEEYERVGTTPAIEKGAMELDIMLERRHVGETMWSDALNLLIRRNCLMCLIYFSFTIFDSN